LAEGLDEDPIVIPSNDRLTALIGVLPLQLIAYELALLKGINPDTPRNLAKVCVVTDHVVVGGECWGIVVVVLLLSQQQHVRVWRKWWLVVDIVVAASASNAHGTKG
ncbi:unnamed protein product, partial [Ectocarpus sp. 12 AP-2014]